MQDLTLVLSPLTLALSPPDMDPYHFVNLRKEANTYDQQRDCKLRNYVIEAIAWYVQVLKSPDASRNEKRTAVRLSLTWLATSTSRFTPGSLRIAAAIALTSASMAGKILGHRVFGARHTGRHTARILAVVTTEDRQQWQQWTPADWGLNRWR